MDQRFCGNVAAVLACALALSACASGGRVLEQAEVDRTILTGSTPQDSAEATDTAQASDALAIRNAVSSANLAGLSGGSLSWANVETGSEGAISGIAEYRDADAPCRRFTASREAFDGVAMFRGDACLAGNGLWRMRSFESL